MQKIEANKGERYKSGENDGTASAGARKFATLKVENVKVEMNKITRRFSRFEGHVDGIKQEMIETKDILGKIKKDIEDLDNYILSL